jgi:hypothetical protein
VHRQPEFVTPGVLRPSRAIHTRIYVPDRQISTHPATGMSDARVTTTPCPRMYFFGCSWLFFMDDRRQMSADPTIAASKEPARDRRHVGRAPPAQRPCCL